MGKKPIFHVVKARRRATGALVTVTVYRCQLVEERTIAVASAVVHDTAAAAALIRTFMGSPDREMFVLLMLDLANHVLGLHMVALGDLATVRFALREVFKPALLRNAERIIVAHNHVGGDSRPSAEDKKLTKRLAKGAALLGIQLSDHIILGRTDFYSFLDEGRLGKKASQ